jgi:hypothetical protein
VPYSGSCGVKPVGVQVPPFAFHNHWEIRYVPMRCYRTFSAREHFAPLSTEQRRVEGLKTAQLALDFTDHPPPVVAWRAMPALRPRATRA